MKTTAPDFMPPWTRPLRMPEAIPVSHAEPPYAFAGQVATWRVPFTLARDVPPRSLLRLQLQGNRNNRGTFEHAQVEDAGAAGYVSAVLDDGTALELRPASRAGTYDIGLPPAGLRGGQRLTVTLGDTRGGGAGIRAPAQRRLNKFFVLYAIPSEKDEPEVPAWFGSGHWSWENEHSIVAVSSLHILGGGIHHLRAYGPATAVPGRPFALLVRPEDEYSTLSHQRPGPLQVELDGQPLEARAEPVARSTCIRLIVTVTREGVHRLVVRDTASGLQAIVNPMICSVAAEPVYWGMIHGHTEMSDGTGTLEQYFHQLKEEVLLDFAATGDHDHLWETSDAYWRLTCDAVRKWHRPHEFVTLLGYEWAKWRRNGDGDRNVYYLEDDRPFYRSDDTEHPTPPDLFKALKSTREKAIVIPHHTGHGGNFCDWKDHDPDFERLVEIFQVRGSYECSPEDGNPVPERASKTPPFADGYVRHALALGWRVGFTAGGDDHESQWGTEFRFAEGYKQGLMCVEAADKTRNGIFQAMFARRVVATTGARMLLSYRLDGHPMGSELSVPNCPGLLSGRTLDIEFHGTAPLRRIEVIRNNRVVHAIDGRGGKDVKTAWYDTAPLDGLWLPAARFCSHPFAFYYVRAIQEDNEVAWASPVWIDP